MKKKKQQKRPALFQSERQILTQKYILTLRRCSSSPGREKIVGIGSPKKDNRNTEEN